MTDISNFYHGGNVMHVWQEALETALKGDRTLFFPEGEYHFYPEKCTEKVCFFSNNDEGIKTIAAYLENLDNFTLKGGNAQWIFHGRISPVVAVNCRNLRIEGISIDFEESFVSDADFAEERDGISYFRFSGKHWVENGRLRFCDDFYDNFSGRLNFLPYDCGTREMLQGGKPRSVNNSGAVYRDGLVGFPVSFADCKGKNFAVKHELRLCPGLVIDRCENVEVINVTIHHAAGMGFLFQNSENLTIDGGKVVPSSRRVAASDDAVHMVECRGKLLIQNCQLQDTWDDSINVHGIYRPLKCRQPGGFFYYLDSGHFQQMGLPGAREGDTLELLKNDTHIPYHYAKIKRVQVINKAMTLVEFTEPLPETYASGDAARVMEVAQAELTVRNCRLKPLVGRGVLASGLKSVRITDNYMHTSGAGVFVSGGVNYWYETGPVEYAVIENNVFDNCNYNCLTATREPVSILPEIDLLPENFYYHGEITVSNNRFIAEERPLVSMKSVRKAVCYGNEYTVDHTYPFEPDDCPGYYFTSPEDREKYVFLHCGEITES